MSLAELKIVDPELEIVCAQCGRDLTISDDSPYIGWWRIQIDCCEECGDYDRGYEVGVEEGEKDLQTETDSAYNRGYDVGREEGESKGYKEGHKAEFEEHEKELKEAFREGYEAGEKMVAVLTKKAKPRKGKKVKK